MAISLPERVLYPFYAAVPVLEKLSPIQDQALGGGIMWVSGHMYIVPHTGVDSPQAHCRG